MFIENVLLKLFNWSLHPLAITRNLQQTTLYELLYKWLITIENIVTRGEFGHYEHISHLPRSHKWWAVKTSKYIFNSKRVMEIIGNSLMKCQNHCSHFKGFENAYKSKGIPLLHRYTFLYIRYKEHLLLVHDMVLLVVIQLLITINLIYIHALFHSIIYFCQGFNWKEMLMKKLKWQRWKTKCSTGTW